jgi:hypothetical protein
MAGETQLMLMIAGLHLLGVACVALLMLPALRDHGSTWGSDSGSDDGWGRGPRRPPLPPTPPRGGIPLPDAEPARVRLRDHRRLADSYRSRDRRPAREPAREPHRRPARTGH